MILSFAGFKGQQQFLFFSFFFLVANTNYLFAIFVRHEMSVRLCGSMYTHSFVCVLVSVSECTRNVLLCVNEFFCGWSHAFSYTERKKQKNVHMNFCASTQRRTLLFMLFFFLQSMSRVCRSF